MRRLLVGLLAAAACSPAATGTYSRPAVGRPAPTNTFPLVAASVFEKRLPLATPGGVHLHQVAIDLPRRSDVLVGRLSFPDASSYSLRGQSPIGFRLFTVGYDGSAFTADVASMLRGKFPAQALARDIHSVYLGGCSSTDGGEVLPTRSGYQLNCTRADGMTVRETLDGATLAVKARQVEDAKGRRVEITYTDYAWFGPVWLPRRIALVADKAKVTIALVGYEPASTGGP